LGTAIGVPLTAVEPRITAAIFGAGFVVYEALIEAARRITVPIQFLLAWDDEQSTANPLSHCSTPSPPGKDAARQPGRPSHHPLDRGRQRVPGTASRPGQHR
jgi:hypothetical protein